MGWGSGWAGCVADLPGADPGRERVRILGRASPGAVSRRAVRGHVSLPQRAAKHAAAGSGGCGGAADAARLSDADTVQALRCDLRWKAACGLGLYDTAFDPSLLTYFRRRLAALVG
ncbi:hypothetical protein Misp03_42270 [Microbispora sp. NBRC 16548]|nr:hypothetical protein Misp03_42270 [Microbispora sp. NBRC 16548]